MSGIFVSAEHYMEIPEHRCLFHRLFGQLRAAVSRSSTDEIASHIKQYRSMPYGDFLQSRYWWIVRNYIVSVRGYHCEPHKDCRSNRLNAHHLTYAHRGEEYAHLEDLTVTCELYHKTIHIDEWLAKGKISNELASQLRAKAVQEDRFAHADREVIATYSARGLYSHALASLKWPKFTANGLEALCPKP